MATEDVPGLPVPSDSLREACAPAAPGADGALRSLRREAIVPSSDRGRLAAIVATCSLAGLAGGMALSMLAETHRAAREMRGYRAHASHEPVTWLGVQIVDAPGRGCSGAKVTTVTPHSPAERVGIRPGDVILRYGGDRVCDDDHLIDVVRASSVGATPEVSVRRGTTELVLHPTLGAMPPNIRARVPADQLRR